MLEVTNATCTGCRVCEQLCPTKSISMQYDSEGFLIPMVDKSHCIACNLCSKRCPQNNNFKNSSIKAFAFQHANQNDLKRSTSGGAAKALSEYILDCGGVVFGCAYDSEYNVVYKMVDKKDDLHILQGSKYVQSDTKNIFSKIEVMLKETRQQVLFLGLPCQVAGLHSFLNKDFDRLITVDIICHGVPSPLFFKKYLEWRSKKQEIDEYIFRDKSISKWGEDYKGSITLNTKKQKISSYTDPFYYAFMSGQSLRESCYDCRYATKDRVGDFTIGDWWGADHKVKQFEYQQGVSVVLANTYKAVNLCKSIIRYGNILDISLEQAIMGQSSFQQPTKRPECRNDFYNDITDAKFLEGKQVPKINFIKNMIPEKIKKLCRK